MRLLPSLAAAVVLFLASGAHAQSMTIEPYGSRIWPATGGATTFFVSQPLNASECSANTPIHMNFTSLPSAMIYLSLWRTSGTTDCTRAMNRSSTSGTPLCTLIDTWSPAQLTGPQANLVEILPSHFFSSCASGGSYRFYILATPTTGDRTSDIPTAANTGAVYLDVTLDATPPPAATLTAAGGETTANIGVGGTSSTTDLYGYRLCTGDSCGGDGGTGSVDLGDCGAIVAASSPSSVAVPVSDLPLGTGRSVAIVLVDRARNEGSLSNVVCASHVTVDGFWDTFCREHGFTTDAAGLAACRAQYAGCSCHVVGGSRGGGSAWGLGLLAAALALVVARRNR